MRIAILGGTGGTGQEVIRQALEAGHEVVAVARRPEAIAARHAQLRVVAGDVMQVRSLESAFEFCDAVVSALGVGRQIKKTTVYSEGTDNALAAMEGAGVRRFIGVTSTGLEHDPKTPWFYRWIVKPLLSNVYADMERMEAIVRRSPADWTIVRPAGLTDGPRTGVYRVAVNRGVPGGTWISRADTAEFLLRALDPEYTGKVVSIAY